MAPLRSRQGRTDYRWKGHLSPDEVAGEAVDLAPRQPGDDEHTLARVLALLDRRSQRIQLVQLATVLIREQKPYRLEEIGEAVGDARPQLVHAFSGECRDLQRLGVA